MNMITEELDNSCTGLFYVLIHLRLPPDMLLFWSGNQHRIMGTSFQNPAWKEFNWLKNVANGTYDAYQVSASLNALASADFKLNLLPIASCPSLSSNCTLKEADRRIQTFILLL
ncbi:hypothetical protein OIU77_004818 [Salix suchowensis]|uniref:Uncharacterized protein n=1 Tax=Salix suchowensis TaxID=1278906 RepID=A0ABQ9AVM3_9ROSI|nr:hypothetical protein OIU77_004818 [Salix suchowensis]